MESKTFLCSFMLDGFKMEMEIDVDTEQEARAIVSEIAANSGGTDVTVAEIEYVPFWKQMLPDNVCP